MRASILGRVSTDEQGADDRYSLENQEQRCRDYAKLKGWTVVKVRKDIGSGKNDERAGFQELCRDVRDGKIDVVLVYRLDRLSRNVRDVYDFLEECGKAGVAFVSVSENFDTSTAMGRAMLGVAAVFAQLTREMISENTKDGLLRRAQSGLANGNRMIYGYDYSPELGLLVKNPVEARQVEQIFEWYLENKWGGLKIARLLNLQGVPRKRGGQWDHTFINSMLRNHLYAGLVRAGEELIEGKHEPIIPRERWQAAQELIASRRIMPPRTQNSKHLLSGIARCGLCGRRLSIHYIHGSTGSKEKKKYLFYYHKRTVQVGDQHCPGVTKAAHLLEGTVVEAIEQASRSGLIQRVVLEDLRSRELGKRAPAVKERDRLMLQIAEIGDRFTQWADRLDSGKIDEEQFALQNQRLRERKAELQKRLAEIEQQLGEEEALEVTLAEVRKMLTDFPTVWEALELEERREVLRLLIEHLKVYSTHAELKILFLTPITVPLATRRGRRPSTGTAATVA